MNTETKTPAGATLDLRPLAAFVLACQNPTLTETATELALSPSSLSAALHGLEHTLQLTLFERSGRHLTPTPAAFWLFQHANALLQLESRASAILTTGRAPGRAINVHLSLDFTLGKFSRAISRLVVALQTADPGTAYGFAFATSRGSRPVAPPAAGREGATEIRIGYLGTAAGSVALMDDPWIALGRGAARTTAADPAEQLVVPRMQQELVDEISDYAYRHGLSARLTYVDDEPVNLPALQARMPGTTLLVPQSMLGDRIGGEPCPARLLDPPLTSRLSARISGPARESARAFLNALRQEMQGTPANIRFSPTLTARQVQYLNAVAQSGGISAASRRLRVTQPTVSAQIQKLETALGTPLFDRGPGGMELTEAGRLLAPVTREIESRLAEILGNRGGIAAKTQSAVAIGLLPSSGHDSAMTDLAAHALTRLRQSHPDVRLRLVEDTNAALHAAVRAGELNVAVVGSVLGNFPRVRLGPSEPLSVVANPALGLAGRKSISLAETCALPLVLGPKFLSIHAVFAEAAADRRLPVNRQIEAGSLPLTISLVRQSPLCTILPASSVRDDLARGRLTATPIREGMSTGNLAMIFSGDRELSEIERAVVRSFKAAFAGTGELPAIS